MRILFLCFILISCRTESDSVLAEFIRLCESQGGYVAEDLRCYPIIEIRIEIIDDGIDI